MEKDFSLTGFVAGEPLINSCFSFIICASGTFSSSIILGLLANLPVAAGPGVGVAAYFAYGLSKSQAEPGIAHQALTICFVARLLMTALALLALPNRIFGAMPVAVKNAMPVGFGLLLALCGFQQMKVVVA